MTRATLWAGIGGAIVLLIILMLMITVRVTKLDVVEPVQWDCMSSHKPTPEPMPSH